MLREAIRRLRGEGAARDWCCKWFRESWESRHDRTIYVYADPPNEYRDRATFWIAMRAVEQRHLHGDIGYTNVPLTLSTSRLIVFCPWCGVNLGEFYRASYQQLVEDEIVREHNAHLNL